MSGRPSQWPWPRSCTIPHEDRSWPGPGGGRARDELHGCAPEDALPQRRFLPHVVGHLPAPSLDVPVPQMVDQLPDIEHFFAALSPDPEQVIEVPQILHLDVPMRARLARYAAGGTAGGSTDDRVLLFVTADCGTARRHSFSWWWRTKFWSSWFSPKTAFNSVAFQKTHF